MLSAASSSTSSPPSFLQSPNAIPPRRSSTGQHHKPQHLPPASQETGSALSPQPLAPTSAVSSTTAPQPLQPLALLEQPPVIPPRQRHHHTSSSLSDAAASTMLPPVPEADWISGGASGTATRRPRKPSITAAPAAPVTTATAPAAAPAAAAAAAAAAPATLANGTDWPAARAVPFVPGSPTTAVLQPAPAPDPARFATEDFGFEARRTWTADKERIVCEPFNYLNGVRGKEFRTQLLHAFNAWLDVPAASLEVIARVVGMLHTASLLVDDVEDASSTRRGVPVAHNVFGVPQTINSANYIYFRALQELQALQALRGRTGTGAGTGTGPHDTDAAALFAEELCNLHRGQGMDLFWRDTLTCPTEDAYLEMAGHKTGGLFRLGIRLMQAEARAPADCLPLANVLGLLFQIQDDYRNLTADAYCRSKGLCEDLTEGKFSFPVIHSIRSDPADLRLLHILKQKPTDPAVKRHAVAYMERTGSFAYTRQVLAVLDARARRLADALDGGHGRSRALHAILDQLEIRAEPAADAVAAAAAAAMPAQ